MDYTAATGAILPFAEFLSPSSANRAASDCWKGTMKKDVQETIERALARFEKRQEDTRQRSREREKFETEWTE